MEDKIVSVLKEWKQPFSQGQPNVQSFVLLSNLSDNKTPALTTYTFNAKSMLTYFEISF